MLALQHAELNAVPTLSAMLCDWAVYENAVL